MKISSNGAYHDETKATGFRPYDCTRREDFEYIVKNFDHSPVLFKNEHRKGDNFLSTDFLYIDIDGGLSIEEFQAHPDFSGCKYIIYTSRSHQKPKMDKKLNQLVTCDRYHVLFPVTTITDRKELEAKLIAISTYDFADKNAKDAARFYFGNKDAVFYYNEGAEFVPKLHQTAFVDDEIDPPKPLKKSFDTANVTSHMSHVTKSKRDIILDGIRQSITNGFIREYQDYINLGMALKADGYDFADWEGLLQFGKPPESTTLQCSRYKWDGFAPHSLTGGTLVHLARLSDPSILQKHSQKLDIAPRLQSDGESDKTIPIEGREPKIRHISTLHSRAPDYLIDGMLEVKSYALIFGEPGSYKSFVAMDWAFCVAAGIEWAGKVCKQGAVLYMFGEGGGGLRRRFDALARKYSIDVNTLPIYYDDDPPAMIDMAQVMARVQDIVLDMPQPPALIIIDTLNTAFGDGNENATEDMTAFNNGSHKLIVECGAAVVGIHHSGIGDKTRTRGSSALHGRLDHEYQCVKNDVNMIFTCRKMKDAEMPEPMAFSFEQVEIGHDGIIPMTSGTLRYNPNASTENAEHKPTEAQEKIYEIVLNSPNGTGVTSISLQLFGIGHTARNDMAVRKMLSRMVADGLIIRADRGVYIANKDIEFG